MRIQGLRSKTTDNGCTESEALLAAAKVAELLDRYDLSLTDVEIRGAPCEQREYETYRKKRIPLDACIGAIANFCDCRVWREKNQAGEARYVFFGLRSDIEVAHRNICDPAGADRGRSWRAFHAARPWVQSRHVGQFRRSRPQTCRNWDKGSRRNVNYRLTCRIFPCRFHAAEPKFPPGSAEPARAAASSPPLGAAPLGVNVH